MPELHLELLDANQDGVAHAHFKFVQTHLDIYI